MRAAYSIPELAALTGLHRHRVRRILDTAGVTYLRSGRAILVTVEAIQVALPDLWASITAGLHLRNVERESREN